MKRAILVVGLLALLVCTAHAQNPITANIPFAFVAGKATLPAGNYEFRPSYDLLVMQVRNVKTGQEVYVPIMARLGTGEAPIAKVTFDEVGGKRLLETVLPTADDGFLLAVTKQKHTHAVVKAG